MIDFHSHVLPSFDDGAKTVAAAMEMLSLCAEQGVSKVVSTSHCYPRAEESITHFLARRSDRLSQLEAAIAQSGRKDLPELVLGCELNMFTDVSQYEQVGKLCVGNTHYLLLEMPYDAWKEWMIEAIYQLTLKGITPIMAHIERFLDKDKAFLEAIDQLDVIYQVNAESFLDRRARKQVGALLEKNRAHLIGSDMHNIDSRPPNLAKAKEAIIKNYGEKCWDYLQSNAQAVLAGGKIDKDSSKYLFKKSIFTKVFGG
jgi:protein-tyrosine phosphatase